MTSATRRTAELAELVGEAALSDLDRSYLRFEQVYERTLINQRENEPRSLANTLDRAWTVLRTLPRTELTMLSASALDSHYPGARA